MPILYELKIEQLIVWIFRVKINQEKLKKDENKQFFYLISKFQETGNKKIFIDLLHKIQLYIKYKRWTINKY